MNILIIDNFPIFRKGIVSVLKENFLDCNIFEASDISEALHVTRKYNAQILFVDISLNVDEKCSFIKILRQESENTKIITMGNFSKREDVNNCINMGVNGIILKNALIEDFIYAIKLVSRGKNYVDPELMFNMNFNNIDVLTKREYDVLMEISKGRSNSDIAKTLFISEHTVKKHIGNIFSKLHLSNRTEAALYAGNIAVWE